MSLRRRKQVVGGVLLLTLVTAGLAVASWLPDRLRENRLIDALGADEREDRWRAACELAKLDVNRSVEARLSVVQQDYPEIPNPNELYSTAPSDLPHLFRMMDGDDLDQVFAAAVLAGSRDPLPEHLLDWALLNLESEGFQMQQSCLLLIWQFGDAGKRKLLQFARAPKLVNRIFEPNLHVLTQILTKDRVSAEASKVLKDLLPELARSRRAIVLSALAAGSAISAMEAEAVAEDILWSGDFGTLDMTIKALKSLSPEGSAFLHGVLMEILDNSFADLTWLVLTELDVKQMRAENWAKIEALQTDKDAEVRKAAKELLGRR